MAKKLLSIALVIVMMFSLAIPSFAADDLDDAGKSAAITAAKQYLLNTEKLEQSIADKATVTDVTKNADGSYLVVVTADVNVVKLTVAVNDFGNYTATVDSYEIVENDGFFMSIIKKIMSFFMSAFLKIAQFFPVPAIG